MDDPRYCFGDLDLSRIRNKNELRVISLMRQVFEETPDYKPSRFDIEDIYALALNRLPARYVQVGSIVLRGEISDEEIKDEIKAAIKRIRNNPKEP